MDVGVGEGGRGEVVEVRTVERRAATTIVLRSGCGENSEV